MKITRKRLEPRITTGPLTSWPRIIPAKHAGNPAGVGPGSSRFSSPTGAFRVLYAAEDFSTAFAEAVVRDRFEGLERRYLYRPHLEALRVTDISSTADLTLLDLTEGGTYELGLDTDATRWRKHRAGQKFSQDLHDETDLDGIIFTSRLTSGRCVVIYERALGKLLGTAAVEMFRLPAFYAELTRMGIIVRRAYGTGS